VTQGCTVPAAACSHRDATAETTGLSPRYTRYQGLPRKKRSTMWKPKESSSEKATSCCWPWPWLQGSSSPDPKAAERQSPAGSEGQPRGPPGLLLHVAAGLLALSPSCMLGLLPQLQRRWEEKIADNNVVLIFVFVSVFHFVCISLHGKPASLGN